MFPYLLAIFDFSLPPPRLPNPYEYEIDHFEYAPDQLEGHDEIMYKSLENTSFTMVKDVATLKLMHAKLKQASEIAIDLEQHSFRSYQGFVCLMQVRAFLGPFLSFALSLTCRRSQHALRTSLWTPSPFAESCPCSLTFSPTRRS